MSASSRSCSARPPQRPTWNRWRHAPNHKGILAASDLEEIREKSQLAIKRLKEAVRRLRADDLKLPSEPSKVRQIDIDRIVKMRILPKPLLKAFFAAMVFDRDLYACRYCERSAAGVWRESKHRRTIGLTCDHCVPRMRGGEDYALNNMRACWSCNGIKSTLPMSVLDLELESLAKAVAARSRRAPEARRASRPPGQERVIVVLRP